MLDFQLRAKIVIPVTAFVRKSCGERKSIACGGDKGDKGLKSAVMENPDYKE